MKRSRKIAVLLALFLAKLSVSVAQIDTVFWFAAPWVTPSHDGNTPIVFRIATFGNPTAVRIHQVAGTYDTTINIAANSLFSQDVSWIVNSVENKPADTVLNRGFKISSDYPITVVYEVVTTHNLNPETYSLNGQNGLGTEFITPFQTLWDNGPFSPIRPFSQANIVASQNNTTIWITPRCNVVKRQNGVISSHPANVTYSVVLNEGESFTVQNDTINESLPGMNMSGTIITSDKPISVTVSDDSVWEKNAGGCRDLMGDQIVPTDVIGTSYVVNKGLMYDGTTMGGTNPNSYNSMEGVFMVASKNFTTITINDGSVTTYTLNQGDTKYFNITQNLTYITADKAIYVMQASGFGCELGEALLPPINCAGSSQVSFTRTNNQTFILNILCKTGAEGAFTLNGSTSLVTAAQFTVVPGTGGTMKGAQIQFDTLQIVPGTANLLTNSIDNFALGVINGGRGTGCLYHYMSSFIRRVYTNAGADIIACTNNLPINLNGSVTGGTTSGIWTTLNGTGTFANPNSLSTTYVLSGADSNKTSITFVLTSTGNCTPVSDTLVVLIKQSPISNAGPDVVMCSNNVSPASLNGSFNYALGVNWSGGNGGAFGNAASATTTYTPSPADISAGQILLVLTATSPFGCPSTTDTMKIQFTPSPTVTVGSDIFICANTTSVSLNGTVSGGSTTGLWSTTGSGTFNPNTTANNPVYTFSAGDLAQGSILIKLTSTNNGLCSAAEDSLTVFVTPAPVVNAGTNDTVCSNMGFINLSGTVTAGASQGTWSTWNGTGAFGNTGNLSTTYTFSPADTSAGVINIVLTSTGGTCPVVKDTVTFTIVKAPVVKAGNDRLICDNAPISLNGQISGFTASGNWTSTGTGSFVPNSTTLNATYYPSSQDISGGTVTFILTSTNNKGCNPSMDTMKISFIASPHANFTFANNCFGTNSILTDSSYTTMGTLNGWNWDFGDGSTPSISPNVVHVYAVPGTYTVTHIANGTNGCMDTIQKAITVYALPTADFNVYGPCSGNFTNFTDTSVAYPATITNWYWSFGDGNGGTAQNPQHIYTNAGTYTATLVVKTNLGCYDTIQKPVVVMQSPNAAFSMSENPANALDVINFTDLSTPQANLVSWFWNFGDSILSSSQNPSHAYLNQGSYQIIFVVTDTHGCKDTAYRSIDVALLPQVPTAFTPNGDGHNDILYVRGGPFEKMQFRVYNNWGELVFQSTDQNIGWDGTVSGIDQPMSVYVWVLDVDSYNGKKVHKSGDVTLMR